MAPKELINSRRRFPKSTFTPVHLGDAPAGADVMLRAAIVRSLDVLPAEVAALRESSASEEDRNVLNTIASVSPGASSDKNLEAAKKLAAIPADKLGKFVGRVQKLREDVLEQAAQALRTPPPGGGPGPGAAPPAAASEARRTALLNRSFAVPQEALLESGIQRANQLASAKKYNVTNYTLPAGAGALDLHVHADILAFLKAATPYLPPGTDEANLDPIAALEEIDRRRRTSEVAIDALLRRAVEPLGLLHIESLEMTPVDVERGELLYSLPLAPKEKVTLSHKEWAVRETEFTDFVQDFLENYSERGVAETDEIAISSETETRRTDRTSIGPSSGMTLTPPVDGAAPGTSVVTNAQSTQESRRHARQVTSNASSRSIRDHKVSFTVATTTGTEDFTSRLIENPNNDKAMRIDYFRRMRRWRVDLYRTGVRLTYDIVIPDPGRRLRVRHELLRRYDQALSAQFDPKVRPSEIDAVTWDAYAVSYNAVIQPPPAVPTSDPKYTQWQLASYATLRDAAFSRFTQVQEMIRQRRVELARQIESAADADALRQLEREQLMRSILEWLFPGFTEGAVSDGDLGNTKALSDVSWQRIMEYGEYVKFIHSAIDWNNLSYILYPYFWSSPVNTDISKLFLKHPDRLHQDFLRAGAARVILPIHAGYESEVASLLDQGRLGKLPAGHRYGAVLEQVQKAQNDLAKLIDVAPPNQGQPLDDANRPRGVLIGSWTEYTPTAALDLGVTTFDVEEA